MLSALGCGPVTVTTLQGGGHTPTAQVKSEKQLEAEQVKLAKQVSD